MAAELQKIGLFMVSARPSEDNPSAPEVTDVPSVSEETPLPEKLDDSTLLGTLENTTWLQRLILIAMLAAGILSGLWGAYQRRHPKNSYPPDNDWSSQIRPGMTRSEIEEKVFPTRYLKGQRSSRTRYLVSPDTVAEIPYDENGGPWSGDNRMRKGVIAVMKASDLEKVRR
ncbi:MAG: hypothetical protein WC859_08980 [Elusimicrobiota bacterium]